MTPPPRSRRLRVHALGSRRRPASRRLGRGRAGDHLGDRAPTDRARSSRRGSRAAGPAALEGRKGRHHVRPRHDEGDARVPPVAGRVPDREQAEEAPVEIDGGPAAVRVEPRGVRLPLPPPRRGASAGWKRERIPRVSSGSGRGPAPKGFPIASTKRPAWNAAAGAGASAVGHVGPAAPPRRRRDPPKERDPEPPVVAE